MDNNLHESTSFEVVFTPTKALAKEFAKLSNKVTKIIFRVFFSVYLFFISLAILGAVLSGNLGHSILIQASVALIGFFMPTLVILRDSRNILKQYTLLGATGCPEIKINFFSENINSNLCGRESNFKYSQITKTITGKIVLYLSIEKTLYVLIKKDSFTKGDYDSFLIFMREKLKDNPKALRGLK